MLVEAFFGLLHDANRDIKMKRKYHVYMPSLCW